MVIFVILTSQLGLQKLPFLHSLDYYMTEIPKRLVSAEIKVSAEISVWHISDGLFGRKAILSFSMRDFMILQ